MLIVLMPVSLVLSAALPGAFGSRGLIVAGAYVLMQVGRSAFVAIAGRGGSTGSSYRSRCGWPGPGDLLSYHTDRTDLGYISHVAIYLGAGKMVQASETGENVEVVPADTGSEFLWGDPGGLGAGRAGGRKYLIN